MSIEQKIGTSHLASIRLRIGVLLLAFSLCMHQSWAAPADSTHRKSGVPVKTHGQVISKPSAVATFACISLNWRAPEGKCAVAYRPADSARWREAMPLWFDEIDQEHRGSIVGLAEGVTYEVKLTIDEADPVFISAATRDSNLPISRTVRLPEGVLSEPLVIDKDGDPSGYVLYEAAKSGTIIDVNDKYDACIKINANFIIVRGIKCVNAKRNGILIGTKHHVVVDSCDVSVWGRHAKGGYGERDHGIYSKRGSHHLLIQRCRIHNPRHGTASWAIVNPVHKERHPNSNHYHTYGPNAIGLDPGPGSNVIRWNEIYSNNGEYFEDGIGVPENGDPIGFPGPDSDIYQNRILNCHDEAIEADGCGRNVRIWGNYMSDMVKGVSVAPAREGPVYVFRNVMGLCRKDKGLDGTGFIGNGNWEKRGAKVYILHNTMLPAGPERAWVGLWGGYDSGPMNLTSRNNIWHCVETPYASNITPPHPSNSYDYDMTSVPHHAYLNPEVGDAPKRPANKGHDNRKSWLRGKQHFPEGAQKHGIVAEAQYQEGHGWDEGKGAGTYQLADDSPGVDKGKPLPNFNDGFTNGGPDIGAHERGTPVMKFGVEAAPSLNN